jgi:hypothetical protein
MPQFRINASYRVNLILDIEAESLDAAWGIARDSDGSDFTPLSISDWEINDVTDMELIKLYGME